MRKIFISLTILIAGVVSAQTDTVSMSDILSRLNNLEKMKTANDTVSSMKAITDKDYAETLTQVATKDTVVDAPLIVFDTMSYDLGNMTQGEIAKRKFIFTNTGTKKLYVMQIVVDCGCTEPEWTQDAVMPGESGYIIVKYDSKDDMGKIQKSLTVVHNSGDGFDYLTLIGYVAPKL